jgi:hypothetical protein
MKSIVKLYVENSCINRFYKLFVLCLFLLLSVSVVAQEYHANGYYLNDGGGLARNSTAPFIGPQLHAGSETESLLFYTFLGQNPYFVIRQPNQGTKYPLFYSPYNRVRIVGNGNLELSGNSKGLTNGDASFDMIIEQSGNVGIGITTEASDKFTVANGNICLWENSFLYKKTFSGSTATFNIRSAITGEHIWMGNQTNHILTLGTNSQGMMDFIPNTGSNDHCIIVYKGSAVDASTISTINKQKYSLFVVGGILSEDFAIGPQSSWADHVFNCNYKLRNLNEVENYIKSNKRLPDIPSAAEVQENGYTLHDMNVKLLQKVEELTLYSIEQNKKIEQLEDVVNSYQTLLEKVERLENQINQ